MTMQRSTILRLGVALFVAGLIGMLAAPITIIRVMPGLHTRTGRHTLVGALGLIAVAILGWILALVPIRRGERWAVAAAAVPFVVVGFPIFVVDATYVARERLWNTLAPQALGLAMGMAALVLCAIGTRKE
ncbi:MAG TPA: hypothetical protein VGQ78_08050 [Vicinamibacteria bacterium]|jgi:hypothetical protein|nr:hypothetical protein [Vicinamibacteria bacterium]